MPRTIRFTLLCSAEEREIIALLAQNLRRSQADAIRLILREAAAQAAKPTSPETASRELVAQENGDA